MTHRSPSSRRRQKEKWRKLRANPDFQKRFAVQNFRTARKRFIHDLDSEWPHSRDEGNRRQLRRQWEILTRCFKEHKLRLPENIMGPDPRVREALEDLLP